MGSDLYSHQLAAVRGSEGECAVSVSDGAAFMAITLHSADIDVDAPLLTFVFCCAVGLRKIKAQSSR